MIEKAELLRMSQAERHELATFLAEIDEHALRRQVGPYRHNARLRRERRLALLVSAGCCVVLAGWIVVLAATLPHRFDAHHWRAVWVNFDVLLLAAFAATAWALWRERQIVILLLVVTGTMLCCDAWFDVGTSLATSGVWISLATAIFAELPLAFLAFAGARRLLRATVATASRAGEGIPASDGAGRRAPAGTQGYSVPAGQAHSLRRTPLAGRGIGEALPRSRAQRRAGQADRARQSALWSAGRATQNDYVFDEAELRRMTEDERHRLARALAAIDLPHPLLDPRVRRRRRFGMMFMIACCVVLAAWIAILFLTLPGNFTSRDWQTAWVGLDIAELAGFASTAWAAWHQRQIVIFLMIITGTLLVCDAWFDVALDYGSRDFTWSVVSALLVELPIAFLLFSAARRLVRVTVQSLMQLTGARAPVPPLWRIPLFADGLEECLPVRLRSPEAKADVTAARGPSSLGIRRSRGESREPERVHRIPSADVLDRLPDDRQRERRRGHRAGGLPARRKGRRGRVAQGVPGHDHHPAGHRSPAFGPRPP